MQSIFNPKQNHKSFLAFQANGSLVIDRTDLRHTGSYKCEASNVVGSTNRIVQLKVIGENLIKMKFKYLMVSFKVFFLMFLFLFIFLLLCLCVDPPVLENSDFLNLTEKVGNNALLPCHAHGTPQPEIQWLHSDNSPIELTERM